MLSSLCSIVRLKFSKLSRGTGQVGQVLASGVKSALRARLCILKYPSLLYVQRSVWPPRIVSAPVGVSVTGEIVAFAPLLV